MVPTWPGDARCGDGRPCDERPLIGVAELLRLMAQTSDLGSVGGVDDPTKKLDLSEPPLAADEADLAAT